MPQIVFPEFRDYTRSTKYPFVDTATLTDNDKRITLPNDLFTDLSIYSPNTHMAPFLIQLNVTQTSVSIWFEINSNGCGAKINLIESAENKDIVVPLFSTGTDINVANESIRTGTLLINDLKLAYLKGLPVGTYTFSRTATEIVPSCYVTLPSSGVTSISVNSRTEGSTVSGNIWLVGCDGVLLRTDDNTPNSIRVDVVGDSMYRWSDPLDTSYIVPKPLRTINGVPPDEYGNFVISTVSSYDALRIQTKPDSIQIYLAGAADGN